jgi:hypothetical protein
LKLNFICYPNRFFTYDYSLWAGGDIRFSGQQQTLILIKSKAVMAAWPIKFTEGSKSGKKHPLPIDLSTENKKAKRSAYEKERRLGRSFNRKWKDKMNKQMTI